MEADTEERESVETWIRSRGGSLLVMSASTDAALPSALARGSGLEDDLVSVERANLRRADLTGAKADEDTIWPKGFDPEAAGVIFE